MKQIKEEEMHISPEPNSPVPEIFSSKKIFFLNSSCSGSRRSEIPHIESDYSRRDEVSRRLFHQNSDLCDCDCASDGCGGCIRRNKQCFFKFFVLALSITLILLLFGSLSYNLTKHKATDESFDFDKTKWVSHYHQYSNEEMEHTIGGNLTISTETEPVLDLPVPLYEHPGDYDSGEDLRRLQYHLDPNLNRDHDQIEPISFPPLSDQDINPQSGIFIIYDGREPPRIKRSISSTSKAKESDVLREKYKLFEELGKPKRGTESNEFLFEKLNGIEGGMEKFWESYVKKGRTVFEPFSLTTPFHSTHMKSEDYSEETEFEDELKSMFMSQSVLESFNRVTSERGNGISNVDEMAVDRTEATTLPEILISEQAGEKKNLWTTQRGINVQKSKIFTSENNFENSSLAAVKEMIEVFNSEGLTSVENSVVTETQALNETPTTETVVEKKSSTQKWAVSHNKDLQLDSKNHRDFRTWSLLHFSLPFSGLFGSSQQDRITAESSPLDAVKGISLADAKKIKNEKKKHLLLNSRVVGGSSDVRLPTGPDVSKPFLNAFETLKTNQQLSFTPSAASQYILPYQMCLFAASFPGPKPSANGPQPRTFSFGVPSLLPSTFDKTIPAKSPYQVPTQQNFLTFSINNYPNALPFRQPIQPSGGSIFGFPNQQPFSQFSVPNRQPIFCTYLQPPLFQFPTVPGTADFSHAKCVDCQGESQKDATFAKEFAFPSGKETICSDDKISCRDGSSCIPLGFWCDNQVHCKDASDEEFCSCRERVSRGRVCDGYVDCPRGEDETACFDCPKSAFSCGSFVSPESCIPLSKRCDGVRDCATGADETECSALFPHVSQNDSYLVPQVTGYLHHNWKGDWFPVCVEITDSVWAKEACAGELGVVPTNVEVRFASVSPEYKGPFIVREEDGTIALQDHCKGHISTFVSCPPMNCGTRIELYNLEHSYLEDEREGRKKNAPLKNEEKSSQETENFRLRREETGRVVGGRESEPKAWPWAIAVYKNGAFHCGGVILDERWILTAAHCMEQYWKHYYEVRGGMLRRFSYSAMEQARTISHVIIHENYDLIIMSNDLALLRLKEPFHFNRWVRPACLPLLQDGISKFSSGPAPGTRCTAVGWGALRERGTDPDQLREVEIPIMMRCKHKEDLVGEEICAGKLEGGKDTCQGDSGGPLLCRDSSSPASWYIAGIVSHGEGCARPGEPGAYTRISLFVDWITANTNDFQLPSVKPLQNCPGFRCRSASKLCIPHKWVCNGFTDCLEAEDEKNCSAFVSSDNFNRKYSDEYKFFREENVEDQKFGEFRAMKESSVSQPPLKKKNLLRVPSQTIGTERTKGLESEELRGAAVSSMESLLKSFTTRKDHGFSMENIQNHSTEGTTLLPQIIFTKEENVEDKIFEKKYIENVETNMTKEREEKRNKESGWKNEEAGNISGAEERREEVIVEGVTSDVEVQKSQFSEEATGRIGEKKAEENDELESKIDSEESEDGEEHSMRNTDENDDAEEESKNESQTIKTEPNENEKIEEIQWDEVAEEEDSEEKREKEDATTYTYESTATNSVTTMGFENTKDSLFKSKKKITKISIRETEAPEDYSLGEEMQNSNYEFLITTEKNYLAFDRTDVHETEPSETEETVKVTHFHSLLTRETLETEEYLNLEEYSTSSFDSTTTLQSSDVATDTNLLSVNSDLDYFRCRIIVQSILASYRCDGFEDCEDGTDEDNCTCVQILANSNPEFLCDGRGHCPDFSDEKNCSKCQENEFHCKSSHECVPLVGRCNGTFDCMFGDDETKCVSLASSPDDEAFLQTEGFMMINRNGVWMVKCQEETTPFGAREAIKVCSTLGTIGYERYENRSLTSNCTGFHVTCAESLMRSVDRYKLKDGSYLWPWNGFVYSDGRFVCSGALLRPRWLLASSHCLQDVSLSKNYLTAKFGGETSSSKTRAIRIDGAHTIPESDAVLLHLSRKINQTESVRPLGMPYIFESDPEKDVCVAVAEDRTVFLKISKNCWGTSRCYKRVTSTPSGCRSKPWVGVIVCQSRFGWYPSSVFSDKSGHCGFEQINFTSLQEDLKFLRDAMDKKVDVFPEPFCPGFRCHQGLCIAHSKECDGRPDCSSEEDESFRLCASKKQAKVCKTTELKCRNGRCIPKVLFGDGIQDCEDESDEPSNITCVEYLRLTAPEMICDRKRNCYDKTDEDYKFCSCDKYKFRCKLSGYCVPKDFVCDGEKDCPGGEDEKQCLGRKIVRNNTKTHLEVMQKSYGIWHTMCPRHMAKERSDALCKDLGFKEALFTQQRTQMVLVPQIEPFSWVKLNQKTSIALRGNRPFVRLVSVRKTCDSITCA